MGVGWLARSFVVGKPQTVIIEHKPEQLLWHRTLTVHALVSKDFDEGFARLDGTPVKSTKAGFATQQACVLCRWCGAEAG